MKFEIARARRVACSGIAAAIIAAALWSGCGGDDDDSSAAGGSGGSGGSSGGSGATFSQVLALFGTTKANCGVCHALAPSATNGGLQFNPAMPSQAFGALVGKTSAGSDQSKCAGKTYVVAGDPSASLLYGKLTATPPCGVRMPMGGTPLSDIDIATVSSWIKAGALNN